MGQSITIQSYQAQVMCEQEQVLSNKDLDLPTQQELLAQFRCDEIASLAFAVFEASVSSHSKPVSSGAVVSGLGESMRSACDLALGGRASFSGRSLS